MFCPKCGVRIEDGDSFCRECGTKIQKGFSSRGKKIIMAEVILLIALSAAFLYGGSRSGDPENVVHQFMKNYNGHNWSEIYHLYNFKEDTFINEECFEKTMDQSHIETLSNITGGYVQNGQHIYKIPKEEGNVAIYVKKTKQKTFFFFDRYKIAKVEDTDLTAEEIQVPNISGVTICLDGIEVKKTSEDEGITAVKVFHGLHKVTFSGDKEMFQEDKYMLNTQKDNLPEQMEYSDKAKGEAEDAIRSYMPMITEAVIKNSDSEVIASCFSSEEKAKDYGSLLCGKVSDTQDQDPKLEDVQLTKCQADRSLESEDQTVMSGIPVVIEGTRTYKINSDDNKKEKDQTLSINGTAYMIKRNGKWLINRVAID